jgi:hypothetical protein
MTPPRAALARRLPCPWPLKFLAPACPPLPPLPGPRAAALHGWPLFRPLTSQTASFLRSASFTASRGVNTSTPRAALRHACSSGAWRPRGRRGADRPASRGSPVPLPRVQTSAYCCPSGAPRLLTPCSAIRSCARCPAGPRSHQHARASVPERGKPIATQQCRRWPSRPAPAAPRRPRAHAPPTPSAPRRARAARRCSPTSRRRSP